VLREVNVDSMSSLLLLVSDLVPLLHSLSQRFPNSCGGLTVWKTIAWVFASAHGPERLLARVLDEAASEELRALRGQSASNYLVEQKQQYADQEDEQFSEVALLSRVAGDDIRRRVSGALMDPSMFNEHVPPCRVQVELNSSEHASRQQGWESLMNSNEQCRHKL